MTAPTAADAIAAATRPRTLTAYIAEHKIPTAPFAAILARLTDLAEPVQGQPNVVVTRADLRRLLDALADTHQTATVSIGQSAESWEQVVARRFMRRSA